MADADDRLLFQREPIAAFGGASGVRDMGLLASASARPHHVFAYESLDMVVLAGVDARSLAKNHPFVDGNKRVSLVVTRVFLGIHGVAFDPPEAETVVMVEGTTQPLHRLMACFGGMASEVRTGCSIRTRC